MCAVTVYVNDRLHHHCGRSAKRNPASQALIAVYLLRERAVGIDAIVKAAVATGTTRTAVHAALIDLPNGDEDLAASMLKGRETLSCAANKVRGRVKLIEVFEIATSDDRIAFARVIGPDALFDNVVALALCTQCRPQSRTGAANPAPWSSPSCTPNKKPSLMTCPRAPLPSPTTAIA